MLSNDQRVYFETFGFLKLPAALIKDIGWIQDEFESAWKSRTDVHHDGSARTIYPGSFITSTPRLSTLIEHPVVNGVLDGLLGRGWSSYGGDGNFYSGDTGWHSDVVSTESDWRAKSTTRHIKVAFYLDALDGNTGALRVIPGSHLFGDRYAAALDGNGDQKGPLHFIPGRDIPCAILDNVPGDLLIFDHRTKHAAFGGGNRRRMFTINNFAPCKTEEEREAARFILRGYRDREHVDWNDPSWTTWIRSLTPLGQRNHALTLELGAEVMAEKVLV
jgi:hypothetical protein